MPAEPHATVRRLTAALLIASPLLGCRATSDRTSPTEVGNAKEPASTVAPRSATGAEPAETPPTPESDAQASLRELLASMGVRYLPDQQSLEVDGWVNMQTGLVEVFACAPQGKTHESVVVLDCVPSGLHAGLLALGLEPGEPVEVGTDGAYRRPSGARVDIHVRWKGDAEPQVVRAEEWLWNERDQRAMAACSWIFAGSFIQPVPGAAGSLNYAADYVKSLVTTYHDATSVLENPFEGGIDDTLYYANERAVPPVGTAVTAIFTASSPR